MEGGLIARIGTTFIVTALAVWVLIPTFVGKEMQDVLEAHEARLKLEDPPELTTPEPWWVGVLPNRKVQRGLDLQGGLDITLEVQVEEAVLSTVQRDIGPVKSLAAKAGLTLGDVRRDRRKAALLIATDAGVTLDKVSEFMRKSFRSYSYSTTETIDGREWWVYTMSATEQTGIQKRAVDQALETIRNRVDETGVKEPSITRKGDTAISIQLPGESDIEGAVAAIGTTARLEFILVDEKADNGNMQAGLTAAKAALSPEDFLSDRVLSNWLQDHGHIEHGRQLLWEYRKVDNKDERTSPLVLFDEIMLTGDDVNNAQTAPNSQTGEYYVQLDFKPRGSAIFSQVTGDNIGNRFAIVLDGQIRSAPVIRSKISGTASIEMGSQNIDQQIKDASTLALVLRSGALPAPVAIGEFRKVGPSMGDRAIKEGVLASAIGGLLVFLFAGIYYRVSGLLADLSLLLNVFLVLALLAAVGATLTLPGICGIALTIGMAVDCNIIIYERIREELRSGKGVRNSIESGFDRAFVAVFDSNIATLLAGVVLYSYGTGPLKGFGVTLMIGIFTTLFTGVFVTRTLMELVNGGKRDTVSI